MIDLPAVKRIKSERDKLILELPDNRDIRLLVYELAKYCDQKHNGYMRVKISKPTRPRTTGWRSQNHHIHGHATEIGIYTGETKDEIIRLAKQDALTKGYPSHTNFKGDIVPNSESDISTVEAGYLIDQLHEIADFLGVNVTEGEDD